MFSFLKKKPVQATKPVEPPKVETPEIRYPKNVKLVKDKIDRIKGKVVREAVMPPCRSLTLDKITVTDYWYIYCRSLTLDKITVTDYWYIYFINLPIKLSQLDKKEIYNYLADKREKQIEKEEKKKERELLKYLKS